MRAGQLSSTLAMMVFCTDELIKMMAWAQPCTAEGKQRRQSRQQAHLHILARPGDREAAVWDEALKWKEEMSNLEDT